MKWGVGGLRDYAETSEDCLPLVVGELLYVVFQLCFMDDGFTPGVTSDEERAEEIHMVGCNSDGCNGGRDVRLAIRKA